MLLECLRYKKEYVNTKNRPRVIKDYEFDFHLSGNMEMNINGTLYKITPKTIIFRRPGDVTFSEGNYDCYVVTLDLAGNVSDQDYIRQRSGPLQKTQYDEFFAALPTFINSKYFDLCVEVIESLLKKGTDVENERVLELLFLVLADAYNSIMPTATKHDDRFDTVFKHIDTNLNRKITLEELASLLSYTPSHFINVFKKNTGVTPFEYIKTKRLKKSENLLITTDLSISTIAEECGFLDTSFFVKQFRAMYGITPNKFRKSRSTV